MDKMDEIDEMDTNYVHQPTYNWAHRRTEKNESALPFLIE